MEALMTRDEFIEYARAVTDDDEIWGVRELIAEHNSEVHRFGDAWPGATLHLRQQIAALRNIERQLARLEHREPRNFHFALRAAR